MTLRDPEGFGNRALPLAAGASHADCSNVLRVEHGASVALSGRPSSVLVDPSRVFRVVNPSQIAESVVAPVEIDVVGLFAFAGHAAEREQNDPMNNGPARLAVNAKHDTEIAATVRGWGKNPPLDCVWALPFALDGSVQRPYAAKVRDFVEAFITDYCAPLFCGRIFNSHRAPFVGLRSGL